MHARRPHIALLTTSIFLLISTIIGVGAYFSFQNQWHKLNHKLSSYGLQLDMEGTSWTWSGLKIPTIEFAGNRRHMMISNLHLSPGLRIAQDSSLFGLKLAISHIHFQAALSATSSENNANGHDDDDAQDQPEELFTKLSEALTLMSEFSVESISGEINDASGQVIYAIKDLSLHLSTQQGAVDYRLARVLYRGRIFLENLEGTIIIDSDSQHLPFLVANGSGLEKNWQAKGHISRDLKSLSVFIKNQGIPREWNTFFAELMPNHSQINYALRLRLDRNMGGETDFDIQLGSTNLMFQHNRLSEKIVGPLVFRKRWAGKFQEQSGSIHLQGFFNLISPRNKSKQITANFDVQKSDILDSSDNDPWELQLTMRPTPCAQLIDVMPDALIGNIAGFQASGHLGFRARLKIPMNNPADFHLHFDQFQEECQFTPDRYLYSASFLRERQLPAQTNTNTLTPQLRALVSPRFNRHLGHYLPLLLVAAEDTGFWSHQGIEEAALEAALRRNLKHGAIAVGGSTITMQTAKNLFLHSDRTLARKFQEIILAKHLERILTKQEILTIYANIIEFGPDLYGIQNAAQVFFGRHPHELEPQQALYLSTILPNPKTYLINFCHQKIDDRTRARMEQVFERFENIRPPTVAAFKPNIDYLKFTPLTGYAQRYCPMTMARAVNLRSRL